MPGPVVPRAPGAISSDRAHWHPAGNGFRGRNSTARTRVLPPVGALVSPGPDHCLHGIPSGWSHDAPFAVRRPAHRPGHALASTSSGGAVISEPARRPAKTARSTLTDTSTSSAREPLSAAESCGFRGRGAASYLDNRHTVARGDQAG